MIRAATFNLENLFDRPKIINLPDPNESSRLLKLADDLQREIAKTTYDKAKIESLLVDLKGYVTVRSDRGKFFSGTSKYKVAAKGRADWDGGIEFIRVRFDDKQRENTAALIRSLKADVLTLIEVEGRQALTDFMVEFFTPAARLGFNMLIDSPLDPRGIDVALAWKKAPLGILRSNAYDRGLIQGKMANIWSRDCLEVELELANNQRLHVLSNHFKSKMGGDNPQSLARRAAQTNRLIQILQTRYDLTKDLVLVMGDLNDTPDSNPIQPLYQTPGLHDVFDIANTPADERYTYYYGPNPVAKRRTQIDYIFVSAPLAAQVGKVEVQRRGMSAVAEGKIPGIAPLAGITSWRNAASDHAAITVELLGLNLP
jgi:endonuclease/exonuclease/phosphatase family metal-dependent hydrolase